VYLRRLAAPPDARRSVRAAWGAGPDDVVVLVPGALERRKGHAVLLAAAERLPAGSDLRFVFAGAGSEEAALRRRAGQLGVAVVFAGFQKDIGACLAAADVVAMPSLQEGLGVAALEAMAAGLPVVASRVGGLGEAVVDGETGVLVAPGDPVALARALAELARDPGRRARLGAAGRRRVLARYTMAQMAEATLACYGGPPCA
jgi:glycosyltransferase involved in cell wall biosynthesis